MNNANNRGNASRDARRACLVLGLVVLLAGPAASQAPGDTPCNAVPLSGPGLYSGTTIGMTPSGFECTAPDERGGDFWFTFTATVDGVVTIDCCYPPGNPLFFSVHNWGFYTGCCTGPQLLDCGPFGCAIGICGSVLQGPVTRGVQYWISMEALCNTLFDPPVCTNDDFTVLIEGPIGPPASTSADPPSVSSVSPDHGPNTGLAGVVITGSRFTGTTEVRFGGSPVLFALDSDNQITADIGSTSTTGFVDVTVVNPCGSGTLADGFDYFAPPRELGTPCAALYLSWNGAPTLGRNYTVTTQNLGSSNQVLYVDWSNLPGRVPPRRSVLACAIHIAADSTVMLGNTPDYTFAIPSDPLLLGVHLRTQAQILGTSTATTQVLDAMIGQ